MLMDDNYHQHHQLTTIHEAEHHIDHNHEMDTTIIPLVKKTEINKITGTLTKITMVEVAAIIETIIIEVELIATTETVIITDTISDNKNIFQRDDNDRHKGTNLPNF